MAKAKEQLEQVEAPEEFKNPNAAEFTTLFVDYCRRNKCKVFTVIAHPSTSSLDENSGDMATIQPGVIVTPYNLDDIGKNHSLFIRVPNGSDFIIWSDDFVSKPGQEDSSGIEKISTAQVHVYEKKNLPKILKAKDRNSLRSAGTGAHLQYIRTVAQHTNVDFTVFDYGDGYAFLLAFMESFSNID